jgi:prepilin-type N-terminal cleavage/methylation domain-containing protein
MVPFLRGTAGDRGLDLSVEAIFSHRAMTLFPATKRRTTPTPRLTARERRGFTLIEVLMVVSALAIIAGVVVPQVTSVVDEARNAAMLRDLREFTMAIERYRMDHTGSAPDLIQNEELAQLMGKTDAEGNLGSGPQFIYGPYLPETPRNALNNVRRVFRETTAPPESLSSRVGWVYHPGSGQIWAGLYPKAIDLSVVQSDGSTQ